MEKWYLVGLITQRSQVRVLFPLLKINNMESVISDTEKQDIIIQFTEHLLNEQKNIEKEYIDFVNDNFWDLI